MPEKRVTLRDVAQATGYTIKTVSRAMHPDAAIAPDTREFICRKARELGYYPNRAASELRSKRSRTIACIVGHLVNPYFGMIVEYVRTALDQLGYTLLLFPTSEEVEEEERAVASALAFGVAGVLFIPCADSRQSVSLLKRYDIPIVLLCRELPGMEVDSVLCDEENAGYSAARHLIEKGHRKLIYVCDRGGIYSIEQRLHGFLRAAEEAKLEDYQILQSGTHDSTLSAMQDAERIIQLSSDGFTAVATFCDMQARHLIGMLRQKEFDCYHRIGLMSFDNLDAITPSGLPLCSVGSDYQAICETAVELLHQRILHHDESPWQRRLFPCKVVCRKSCENTLADDNP